MKCERCGQPFGCEMEEKTKTCWCKDMPPLRPIPDQYKKCLCVRCLRVFAGPAVPVGPEGLLEGEDFYYQNNFFVFTEKYHLKRGSCCKSNCKHCPYGFEAKVSI